MKIPRLKAPRPAPALAPEPGTADRELFRSAIGPVRELPPRDDVREASRPRPAPEPRLSEADERAVLDELLSDRELLSGAASGEVLSHLQSGYSPKLLRKLRRGHFRLDSEIDLHHLRTREAEQLLAEFFREARREGWRCLRVVHGKGSGGQDASVLKALVDRWLRLRKDVIAFTSARIEDGGTGAVMVLVDFG